MIATTSTIAHGANVQEQVSGNNFLKDLVFDGDQKSYEKFQMGLALAEGAVAIAAISAQAKNNLKAKIKKKGMGGGRNNIEINNPVLDNVRSGSALKGDAQHAFNDIIDNYAGYATKFTIKGGDGVKRKLYQIKGSLNGKSGIFEWIVDPKKGVTHRRFIEGVGITGKPNARP